MVLSILIATGGGIRMLDVVVMMCHVRSSKC
jgi:hypothetical protein